MRRSEAAPVQKLTNQIAATPKKYKSSETVQRGKYKPRRVGGQKPTRKITLGHNRPIPASFAVRARGRENFSAYAAYCKKLLVFFAKKAMLCFNIEKTIATKETNKYWQPQTAQAAKSYKSIDAHASWCRQILDR